MGIFKTEREGQMAFFDNYNIDYINEPVLVDYTDGIYNGNIFEFKLTISNLNKVLLQAIKYLSKMRIKGESIPANIILVDLNNQKAYIYNSKDYFNEIHTLYNDCASKNNKSFVGNKPKHILNYSKNKDSDTLKDLLIKKKDKKNLYMPIDIDENCIRGWAERYYRELPNAKKGDFIGDEKGTKIKLKGEIREPKHFLYEINPYTKETNEKFKYLMDCLNDRLNKKDLGAFYTPIPYCEKASELVIEAINKIPKDNDYIILDRCAGTGNLERVLINKFDKNGDEIINHCIVGTYEYYEYKVLFETLGDKVRHIIPPTESNVVFQSGMINNADAMSEEFINNELITQYINNKKCSIILFENPPYRDASGANKTNESNSISKKSYVYEEMSKVKENFQNTNISTVRDLNNQFVWSGFKHYIRQKGDSYILLSPAKWWKNCGIVKNKCIKGHLYNRKYFHAHESAITCVWWGFEKSNNENEIMLTAYKDMNNMNDNENVKLKKCYNTFSSYFIDKKTIKNQQIGIFCENNGKETSGRKCDGSSIYSKDIIGYVTPKGFLLDPDNNNLVRCTHYNNRGTYVTTNNYLFMCPLFVAKELPREKFYEKGEGCIYYTTSDGGTKYTKDSTFLLDCLIYTCLSNQNKCLSFKGSDKRVYLNELCFDKGTIASKELAQWKLDDEQAALIDLWKKIYKEAIKTKNYKNKYKYGVYQITKELNTFKILQKGSMIERKYDYPVLNGYLEVLVSKLRSFYKTHIKKKMFKYELLK